MTKGMDTNFANDIKQVLELDQKIGMLFTELEQALSAMSGHDRFYTSLRNKAQYRAKAARSAAELMHDAINEFSQQLKQRYGKSESTSTNQKTSDEIDFMPEFDTPS